MKRTCWECENGFHSPEDCWDAMANGYADAMYEYVKDKKMWKRDRKQEREDYDALCKDLRDPNVNEV